MFNKPIYLDYNATAPLRPEIKAILHEYIDEPLNPSSIHGSGRRARKLVEKARQNILNYINADNLIFCSSGTEANNLALAQNDGSIVSVIEHESVYKSFNKISEVKVTTSGLIDLGHLEKLLQQTDSKLVSLMLANNETGIIQPIKEAARIAHKYGALIHTDAVQAFGKISIDFKDLDVDMMTISCHKIGGPIGAAALIYKTGIEIKALMFGGGQEKNKRPGTENVPAIISFGKLAYLISKAEAELALSVIPSEDQETQKGIINNVSRETLDLRDYLEGKIKSITPNAIIFGEDMARLPNTSCIAMPGVDSAVQLIDFDTNNICISTGSACSSGKVEVSRVLNAMGTTMAKNAIRVSTGWNTSRADIDEFVSGWQKLYNRSKEKAA